MPTVCVYIEYNEDSREWNIFANQNNLLTDFDDTPSERREKNENGAKVIGKWLIVNANPSGLAGSKVRELMVKYLQNKTISNHEKDIFQSLKLIAGKNAFASKIKMIHQDQKWLGTHKYPPLRQYTDKGASSTNPNLEALRVSIMNFPRELALEMHSYCDAITILPKEQKKIWNLHGSYHDIGTEAWDNMMSNGTIAGYQAAYLAPFEVVSFNYERIRGHTPNGLSTTLNQEDEVTLSIEAVNMFTNSMKELLNALEKDDKNNLFQQSRDNFRKWAINQIMEVAYLVSSAENDPKLSTYKEKLKKSREYLINNVSNDIQDTVKKMIEQKNSAKALADLSIYGKDHKTFGVENKSDQDQNKHVDKTHIRGIDTK